MWPYCPAAELIYGGKGIKGSIAGMVAGMVAGAVVGRHRDSGRDYQRRGFF